MEQLRVPTKTRQREGNWSTKLKKKHKKNSCVASLASYVRRSPIVPLSVFTVAAMKFQSSPNAAFNQQRLLKALQLWSAPGSVAFCIHSLLAQAGPITRCTHAWDRPSVIQIVCTTYGSYTGEQTWQPLIGAALSVGRAWVVSTVQPTEG